MSITVSTLGFPRIGPRRELKSALERFWARKTNAQSLLADAAALRAASWARRGRDSGDLYKRCNNWRKGRTSLAKTQDAGP